MRDELNDIRKAHEAIRNARKVARFAHDSVRSHGSVHGGCHGLGNGSNSNPQCEGRPDVNDSVHSLPCTSSSGGGAGGGTAQGQGEGEWAGAVAGRGPAAGPGSTGAGAGTGAKGRVVPQPPVGDLLGSSDVV